MIPAASGSPALAFLGERIQVAFVLDDFEPALRYWTETLKVGPFVVIENALDGRTVTFRGERTDMNMALAFAYVGDVQIEFVQPTNDAPSPFREFLTCGRKGLHHIAYWPADFEGACVYLERNGFDEICSIARSDGGRDVVYYEPPDFFGTIVELVPWTPFRGEYFGRIQQLSVDWDGSRPVRRFGSRAAFLESSEGAA
jgi:catechol 2,3-dioxygenase-like lactoylglutathione lyase family enzyme